MRPGHSISKGKALFVSPKRDSDLFKYYLSSASPLKFKEFGKGDFVCSKR